MRKKNIGNRILSAIRCAEPMPMIVSALCVLAIGILTAVIGGDRSTFSSYNKPSFTPPAFVFPIVWTVIYILIGAAAGAVLSDGCSCSDGERFRSLFLFTVGLLLNYMWYPLFFGAKAVLLALADLAIMLILAFATARMFRRINYFAGVCMWIYFGWLCFAFILNLSVLLMN